MSFKNKWHTGFRPSPIFFLVLASIPLLLACNQLAMLRRDELYRIEHCSADSFCYAGSNSIYLAGSLILFLVLILYSVRHDFRPAAVVRSGSRVRLMVHQGRQIAFYALFFAAYTTATAAILGWSLSPSAELNWDKYESLFFFENMRTAEDTLPHIVFLFFCNSFFTLLFTGLLGLWLRWLCGRNSVSVLVILLLYLPSTSPLMALWSYYGWTSLWIDQWTRYPVVDLVLPVQAGGTALIWIIGLIAARRKDFLNG